MGCLSLDALRHSFNFKAVLFCGIKSNLQHDFGGSIDIEKAH